MSLRTSQPRRTALRNDLAVILLSLLLSILVIAFSSLRESVQSTVSNEPRFQLSLSGALGDTILLEGEEVNSSLLCNNERVHFSQPSTHGLYGLELAFHAQQPITKPTAFTLGGSQQLTLHLTSSAGAYRTFTASEGELSLDPMTKRGYLTAFLYDEQSERVFASASWVCP
jgi:hypothetical protein